MAVLYCFMALYFDYLLLFCSNIQRDYLTFKLALCKSIPVHQLSFTERAILLDFCTHLSSVYISDFHLYHLGMKQIRGYKHLNIQVNFFEKFASECYILRGKESHLFELVISFRISARVSLTFLPLFLRIGFCSLRNHFAFRYIAELVI